MDSNKSDEYDEEESEEFESGSESELFVTFGTRLGGLLSGVEFSIGVMLTSVYDPAEPYL